MTYDDLVRLWKERGRMDEAFDDRLVGQAAAVVTEITNLLGLSGRSYDNDVGRQPYVYLLDVTTSPVSVATRAGLANSIDKDTLKLIAGIAIVFEHAPNQYPKFPMHVGFKTWIQSGQSCFQLTDLITGDDRGSVLTNADVFAISLIQMAATFFAWDPAEGLSKRPIGFLS